MNVSCQACGRTFTVETRSGEGQGFVSRCPECGAPVLLRAATGPATLPERDQDLPVPRGWQAPGSTPVAIPLDDLPAPVDDASRRGAFAAADTLDSMVAPKRPGSHEPATFADLDAAANAAAHAAASVRPPAHGPPTVPDALSNELEPRRPGAPSAARTVADAPLPFAGGQAGPPHPVGHDPPTVADVLLPITDEPASPPPPGRDRSLTPAVVVPVAVASSRAPAGGGGRPRVDLRGQVPGLEDVDNEFNKSSGPPPTAAPPPSSPSSPTGPVSEDLVDLLVPRDYHTHAAPPIPSRESAPDLVAPRRASRTVVSLGPPVEDLPAGEHPNVDEEDPGEELRPVVAGEVRPVPGNEVRPVSGDELRPLPAGEVRPVSPYEVRPVAPGEVRPVSPYEVRPVAAGEVRPVSPDELRPQPAGEVRPVVDDELRPQAGSRGEGAGTGGADLLRPAGTGLRPVHVDELEPAPPGEVWRPRKLPPELRLPDEVGGEVRPVMDDELVPLLDDDPTSLPRRPPAASPGVFRFPRPGSQAPSVPTTIPSMVPPPPLPIVAVPPPPSQGPPSRMRQRRRQRWQLGLAAALVLLAAVAAVLFLTDLGAPLGIGQAGRERARKLEAGARLLADDTVASYRKAAGLGAELADPDRKLTGGRALEAQARLAAVLLGQSSEMKAAEKRLAELSAAPADDPAVLKARALRALVDGKTGEAESLLGAALTRAARDPAALTYLGWTHLLADAAGPAVVDFTQALAVEPGRAQALVGLGRAREAQGDAKGAAESFKKALAASPDHFGAAVALERLGEGPTAPSDQRLQQLLEKRAATAGPREVAEAWVVLALRSFDEGRLEEAEARYRKATAIFAPLLEARVGLARTLCALRRPAEALPVAEGAAKQQPQNPTALLVLAEAQIGTASSPTLIAATLAAAEKVAPKAPVAFLWGRFEETRSDPSLDKAIDRYRQAVAADPHFVAAYMALAQALVKVGKADEASGALREADEQAFHPALRDQLGEAYLAAGRLDRAENLFREVVKSAPGLLSARYHLGETLERQGRLEQAAATYAEVAALQKDAPGLAERRGRVALALHRTDESLTFLQEAVASDPNPSSSLLTAAGEALLSAGRSGEARPLFERAVAQNDRLGPAQLGLARCLLEEHRLDEAEAAARRAVLILGTPRSHLVMGQVQEARGKLDLARTEYATAARRGSAAAADRDREAIVLDARIGSVRVLARGGAVRDALHDAQQLSQEAPGRSEPLVLIGDCQAELGRPDAALAAYQRATHLGPQNPEAHFKLGRAQADEGLDRLAARSLDEALRLGGDRTWFAVEALLLAGDVHRRIGEAAPAVDRYKRYLKLAAPDAPARRTVDQWLSSLSPSANP